MPRPVDFASREKGDEKFRNIKDWKKTTRGSKDMGLGFSVNQYDLI